MSNRNARSAGLVLRALLALAVAGLAGATVVPSALAQSVTINATSGAGGTIMPKGKVQVPVGGSQRFDIVPGAGYSIKSVAVNGRALGAPASYTFTDVRTAQTIKATFQVSTYTLTVATSGGFTAKPVSNGTISAKHGKTLRFTITPGGGTRPEVTVDGQPVAVSSSAKSYAFSLRVTGPHRVVIGLAREVLAVQKTGSGGGTVTSNPAGIDCGSTCAASFPRGQSVTLTAAPAAGSTFGGWSGGGCAGTGPTCSVSLAASAAVTARFDAVTPRYALTVAKSGTGTGTVTSSPAGIDCGADCSESWDAGQQVTLTAAPAGGSSFAGWSGGACAGTNPVCQLTMNAAVSVTAAFQAGAPVSDQTIADLALAGHVTASAAYAALEFAVQGVWEASRQAGQPTFTGTLTEVGTSGAFTYTPTPTDKLVGVFTSGVRVEIRIIRFTGYTGGDWNDFMKDHDVAFEFFSANVVNIRMESLTLPGTVGAYQWTRTYQGELVIRGQAQPIQRRDEGNAKNFSQETDSSFETLEYRTGTVGLAGAVATIDDAAWSLTMNNFAVGRTVRNQRRTSNSSLPAAGGTLKYDGLDVRWETTNTVGDRTPYLSDPGYWYALGGLLQGGAKIGQIQFDGPVSAYTTGPAVIVNLGGERAVRLWKPIVGPGEQPVPVSWEGLLVRPPE